MAEYIRISTLNALARQVLEQCEPLSNLILLGEISNFTRHYKSGHLYFTLKDETASVKAVMFRDKARLLGFPPQNGMLVLAYGRATLYERDGAFQVYVEFMRPFGAGAAQMAFDALKKKLEEEGLFAAEHKRPPAAGAALHRHRHLQDGGGAAGRLQRDLPPLAADKAAAGPGQRAGHRSRAEHRAGNPRAGPGRPGGSDPYHARRRQQRRPLGSSTASALHGPPTPAASRLFPRSGMRSTTRSLTMWRTSARPPPSAAAELCVPDKRQFLQEIYNLEQNIQKNIQSRLQMCYNRVNALGAGAALQAFHGSLEARAQQVDRYAAAASGAAAAAAAAREQALRSAAALAASLDPYAVLARGYAMVRDGAGNCRTVDTLHPGQNITLCGAAAQAVCTVQNVTKTQGDNANENAENL